MIHLLKENKILNEEARYIMEGEDWERGLGKGRSLGFSSLVKLSASFISSVKLSVSYKYML